MLDHLFIQDFAIISELHLDFDDGLSVFSGETGAGKSILIDALTLVLGARADSSVIRQNQPYAEISAEFRLNDETRSWLSEQGLDDEDQLILRRRIDQQGRSRAFINGKPVPITQLKELGLRLVEIHGQHTHQNLMEPRYQRQILDLHGQLNELVQKVKHAWQHQQTCAQQLNAAQQHHQAHDLLTQQIRWQLDELSEIAPQPEEWLQINVEHKRLAHATQLIEHVQSALYTLTQADHALLSQLNQLTFQLQQLTQHDPALQDILKALEPACIQLDEAASSLTHYAEKFEFDADHFTQVEKRLEILHRTARKFKIAPESLFAHYQSLQTQFDQLQNDHNIAQLETAFAQAQADYQALAKQLSAQRKKIAQTLSTQVTEQMQQLAMQGGQFDIQIHPLEQPQAHGLDQIEFKVRGHAGTELRALSKVASGGELARISLALAVIASQAQLTATLIFDEVDIGIGGATAQKVGQLLQQLANNRQVLCVTHLPQVAACGQHHFQVHKTTDHHNTLAQVRTLSSDERISEIARMLGGIQITETTTQHAQEMLHFAKKATYST